MGRPDGESEFSGTPVQSLQPRSTQDGYASKLCYLTVRSRHRKTLASVFTDPINGNIPWRDIEALLTALGANSRETGGGVTANLQGVVLSYHRPHSGKEAGRGLVKRVREFLTNAGVAP